MIKTEKEYRETLRRVSEYDQYIAAERRSLLAEGLSEEEIGRLMEPAEMFFLQLKTEADWYQMARERALPALHRFTDIGGRLIALRIALGITQTELAARLHVDNSVISRYERNEYRGITLERLQEIVDALSTKPTIDMNAGELVAAG